MSSSVCTILERQKKKSEPSASLCNQNQLIIIFCSSFATLSLFQWKQTKEILCWRRVNSATELNIHTQKICLIIIRWDSVIRFPLLMFSLFFLIAFACSLFFPRIILSCSVVSPRFLRTHDDEQKTTIHCHVYFCLMLLSCHPSWIFSTNFSLVFSLSLHIMRWKKKNNSNQMRA